ncbi:hypothetical protein Dimus_031606 [Dionaea muscipula]
MARDLRAVTTKRRGESWCTRVTGKGGQCSKSATIDICRRNWSESGRLLIYLKLSKVRFERASSEMWKELNIEKLQLRLRKRRLDMSTKEKQSRWKD